MNQREIKFRVWDNVDYMSKPFTLYDLMGSQAKIEFTHDCIVMQYTGLNDKDGQEIYEGDILTHIDCVGVCTVVYGKCEFYAEGFDELGYDLCAECTVIGNIYQNPELLQQ